jgi:DNA-binding SARP family transcriptional activator
MRLFGDLQLRWDGARLVDFSSKKGKALLCYLAVTGQPQSRAALSGLLWPESPEENARASLRRTLTGIRKMAPDCLSTTRQTAAVNADAQISVDVIRFAALVADGAATDDLQEAVALYQGDFLERFYLPDAPPFDRWALGQRARLRQMALEALHSLAVHFAGRREYGPAVSYARQVLDIEPWRESGHRDLMRLLALSGQRSAALKQYETCCQLLADELSVAPAAETTTLYERIRDEALRAGDGPDSLAAENKRVSEIAPTTGPQLTGGGDALCRP